MEWKKIFANNATDKGLISKIYIQLNIKKSKQPNQKMVRSVNRHFSKEDIHIVRWKDLIIEQMKRCSTLLIIRKLKPQLGI